MTKQSLRWGPFSVGAVATTVVAIILMPVNVASYGYWWFWPLAAISGLAIAVLAVSAALALTTPPKERAK